MEQEDQSYKEARRHVKKLRHFYGHLTTYGVVIVFLHIINLLTSSYYWAVWPMLGWGVGVALHGIQAFGTTSFFGPDWEEKQIQKYLAKKNQGLH